MCSSQNRYVEQIYLYLDVVRLHLECAFTRKSLIIDIIINLCMLHDNYMYIIFQPSYNKINYICSISKLCTSISKLFKFCLLISQHILFRFIGIKNITVGRIYYVCRWLPSSIVTWQIGVSRKIISICLLVYNTYIAPT